MLGVTCATGSRSIAEDPPAVRGASAAAAARRAAGLELRGCRVSDGGLLGSKIAGHIEDHRWVAGLAVGSVEKAARRAAGATPAGAAGDAGRAGMVPGELR
jgi:hypothetical protein